MCSMASYTFIWSCWLVILTLTVCDINAAGNKKIRKISIENKSTRIVNGEIIRIEEAPFMVQIKDETINNSTVCGGTLISPQHILTAAHCVDDSLQFVLSKFHVIGGASKRNQTGVERRIVKVFIHPDYKFKTSSPDVAVLKLDKPFHQGKKIRVQKEFCTEPVPVGENVKVTGWGATKAVERLRYIKPEDYSNDLRRIRLSIISNDDCAERYRSLNQTIESLGLDATRICAFKQNAGTCVTDSGGPGIYGNKLCMVVSSGYGCAQQDKPSFYTSIPTVLDFIKEKLQQ